MGKAKDIFDGWKNYLIDADQTTIDEAKRRSLICSKCSVASRGLHTAILPDFKMKEIQGMYCDERKGGCGCPLSPAVRSLNYRCELGKWEK